MVEMETQYKCSEYLKGKTIWETRFKREDNIRTDFEEMESEFVD
jgi:hypothetical protein